MGGSRKKGSIIIGLALLLIVGFTHIGLLKNISFAIKYSAFKNMYKDTLERTEVSESLSNKKSQPLNFPTDIAKQNFNNGKSLDGKVKSSRNDVTNGYIDVEAENDMTSKPAESYSGSPLNFGTASNPVITIAAVGDVMLHEGQILSGYDARTGTYDFNESFEDIKGEISSADIAMANLETTLGGKDSKFSGYPLFNSPDELADALKYAGFDVVVTSNNHCLDRGYKGLVRTLKVLREKSLVPVGTYASEKERNTILVMEIKGVKVAILAYTYGTNGNPIPHDKPYLVNLIDENIILKDISKAKESADAVVIYLHNGQEYERVPSEGQRKLAHLLLKKGADVIIASHPHVLQPGEWVNPEESQKWLVKASSKVPSYEGTKKYVAYSMGNFISAQRFPYTEEGVILKVTLEKNLNDDRTYVKDVREVPTWVDKFRKDGKMRYIVRLGKRPAVK